MFGILSIMGSASATTVNASSSVHPGDNIQSAVDNATSGDTITIYDNNGSSYTYNENLIINKTINLVGSGNVTINAANSSNPTITLQSGAINSTITGLTITGAINSYGIDAKSTTNCTITNNTITNNYIGIFMDHSRYITITNNTITNNTWSGVCGVACSDITGSASNVDTGNMNSSDPTKIYHIVYIQGNSITNNQEGIFLTSSNGTECRWIWILNNLIKNNTDTGITIINSANMAIQNNNITNNLIGIFNQGSYGMEMYFCTCGCDWGIDMENNNITNNTWAGICLDRSCGDFILNNNITGNSEGIFISDGYSSGGSYSSISGNSIANNTNTGVSIIGNNIAMDNSLNENIITGNYIGIFTQNDKYDTIQLNTIKNNKWAGICLDGAAYNTINNNEIIGNLEGIFAANGSNGNTINLNNITSNTGNGITVINGTSNIIKNNAAISENGVNGIFIQNGTSNTLQGNTLSSNTWCGVCIDTSTKTTVKQNNIENNPEQALTVNGSDNMFVSNYWSDWTTPDTDDDGTVDTARSIDGNESIKDGLPCTEPY